MLFQTRKTGFSSEHKWRYFWWNLRAFGPSIDRFGTTWGWVISFEIWKTERVFCLKEKFTQKSLLKMILLRKSESLLSICKKFTQKSSLKMILQYLESLRACSPYAKVDGDKKSSSRQDPNYHKSKNSSYHKKQCEIFVTKTDQNACCCRPLKASLSGIAIKSIYFFKCVVGLPQWLQWCQTCCKNNNYWIKHKFKGLVHLKSFQ